MCKADIKYFDNSAPSCPAVECPEGFKVVLKKLEQLKTPEESSAAFKGRFKGMSLSAYPVLNLFTVDNVCK
jgi:hypothetical protein